MSLRGGPVMTTIRRRFRAAIGWMVRAAIAAAALAPADGDASTRLEKLPVGVVGLSAGQAGVFRAQEAGFFAAEGLDVELVFFTSGTEGLQALVSGQLSLCSGAGGPPLINAVLAGARVAWVAEFLGTMPYALLVVPGIERPADLRGKRLGISRFGATTHFATRYAVRRLGLDPERDVTILQVGEQSARLAAMRAGGLDGTVLSPPVTAVARRLGFRQLADLASLGLRYPHEGLAVSRALLESRPETVQRFLRAVVRGTHRFKTRREEGIRVLAKYLKMDDPAALAETYAFFAPLVLARPYVPREGVELILAELAASNPAAAGADPERFVDTRVLRALEAEGLFERLYGAGGGARP